MQDIKIVIAGHIDHGKSTLIGRMLHDTESVTVDKLEEIKSVCSALGKDFEYGYITDSLEEERSQGITIDTSQISFSYKNKKFTFIDAPGHFEFESNMVTGASRAEAAVLIVDINEGIKEQTFKHAYILGMLGIRNIMVVFNKMDLLNYDNNIFYIFKNKIKKLLGRLEITPDYIIPVSSKNGDMIVSRKKNMDWYKDETVIEALLNLKAENKTDNVIAFFSVQDVYENIIVGRVEEGIIKKGDSIEILPAEKSAKIVSIEEYNKDSVKNAEAGKAVGLVLEDRITAERGNIICIKNSKLKISNELFAHIIWMDEKPLLQGEKIIFRCLTQEVSCEIAEIERVLDSSALKEYSDRSEVNFRETADVILKTDKPIVAMPFSEISGLGKFVLERNDICCAGIVKEVY